MISTATEDQLVLESSSLLQENYYFLSEIIVDHLLKLKPNSCNYNYRKGFMLLDVKLNAKEALPYLIQASKDIDKNYDMYSASENSCPTDVIYHLGRCYQLTENLDSAILFYERFINESNPKSNLVNQSKLKIIQCRNLKELKTAKQENRIFNLGPRINTQNPETAPIITTDGNLLYITSNRRWENEEMEETKDPVLNNYPEDIYQINLNDSEQQNNSIQRLSFCYSSENESCVSLSPDERQLFLYENLSGNGDIYFSNYENGEFSPSRKNTMKDLNSKNWETHSFTSLDGRKLFFVSDRPGGFGGKDIYCIEKDDKNSWGKAYNLGSGVNSEYDEEAPFLASDGKTLFFASNGLKSMGEFDILSSKYSNGIWQNATNLGYPFNSSYDDDFFTLTANGEFGYFSSNREGGFGQYDIYMVEMPKFLNQTALFSGFIKTSDGSPIPPNLIAFLTCENCPNSEKIEMTPRFRDGNIITQLEPCKTYSLGYQIDDENIEKYTYEFTTDCNLDFQIIRKDVIYDVLKNRVVPEKSYMSMIKVIDSKTHDELDNVHAELILNNDVDTFTFDKLYINQNLQKFIFGDTLTFKIKLSKPGYLTQEFNFSEQLLEIDTIISEFSLEASKIGIDLAATLDLKPIYFDLNKFNIRDDAKIELDKIVKIMNDNPEIIVELSSHTDCRGSASYNLELSDKRAKASAIYIQERISQPERIYGKGYGESQLLNDCPCEDKLKSKCPENEHQKNRRTEFKIIKN
jgi:outer membrane protein OmpA-like peptidoglycan-associated protein/Tol biopolymer transport system component